MTQCTDNATASARRRRARSIAVIGVAAALVIGASVGTGEDSMELAPGDGLEATEEPARFSEPTGGESPQLPRLREGTQLTDCLGRFLQEGESLTFVDKDGREIGGLPNLNLERIIRMLKSAEEPDGVWWSVSGVVTEFSERNFLLVTRAVYKTAAPPPTPESVE